MADPASPLTDDRFVTRGVFTLFALLTVILVVAGLTFAAFDIGERFPEWAASSAVGLIGVVLGFVGGRGLGKSG